MSIYSCTNTYYGSFQKPDSLHPTWNVTLTNDDLSCYSCVKSYILNYDQKNCRALENWAEYESEGCVGLYIYRKKRYEPLEITVVTVKTNITKKVGTDKGSTITSVMTPQINDIT